MPALSWTARGRSRWWCSPAAAPCLLRGSDGDPGNRRKERKPEDFQCIKWRNAFFFFLRREVYKGQFSPTYHVLLLLLLIEGWVSFPPQLRHLLLVTQLTVCWGLRPNRDECLNKEDFALAFPPFTFWWVPLKGRNESVPWMWIFDDNKCIAEVYSFQSMLIFTFYHCLVKFKNVKFHNCNSSTSHICVGTPQGCIPTLTLYVSDLSFVWSYLAVYWCHSDPSSLSHRKQPATNLTNERAYYSVAKVITVGNHCNKICEYVLVKNAV